MCTIPFGFPVLPLVTPETLDRFSFVTDDKDVDDLLTEGHIDHILRKAVQLGVDLLLMSGGPAPFEVGRHQSLIDKLRQKPLLIGSEFGALDADHRPGRIEGRDEQRGDLQCQPDQG